ncbi:MAG: flavoprotein [Candidatus Altiarchaeota archaeon]
MRILWCITGGGYMLEESCRAVIELSVCHDVTVAFSRAGREVATMYNHLRKIEKAVDKTVYEEKQGYSSPLVCKLGQFDLIVISPCTANTVAKIVCGIADSLVSNIAAQALKSGKVLAVLPTDIKKGVTTAIPSGKRIKLKCRKIDFENSRSLKKVKNVKVFKHPKDIIRLVKNVD